MTTRTADLFVRSATGLPVALIEVRNRQNLTLEVAMELQQDLLDYFSGLRDGLVPYFLMLSQETGFLWDLRKQQRGDDPPICVFPMQDVVAQYWPNLLPHERLRGSELELVVFQWLSDLANGRKTMNQKVEYALAQTDFLQAIHEATVQLEELA